MNINILLTELQIAAEKPLIKELTMDENEMTKQWSVTMENCAAVLGPTVQPLQLIQTDNLSLFPVQHDVTADVTSPAFNVTAATVLRETCEALISLSTRSPFSLSSQQQQHDDHASRRYYRELLTYLLMGVAGTTVGCFGLIGNLLSLVVLTRRTMRTSTYCYLATLAVCDLLLVSCTLVLLVKVICHRLLNAYTGKWVKGAAFSNSSVAPLHISSLIKSLRRQVE